MSNTNQSFTIYVHKSITSFESSVLKQNESFCLIWFSIKVSFKSIAMKFYCLCLEAGTNRCLEKSRIKGEFGIKLKTSKCKFCSHLTIIQNHKMKGEILLFENLNK